MTHPLIDLLRYRLEIISDHAWRDRDSAQHLAALQEVSEKISHWVAENRITLDSQLRHYLANASYQKALLYLEQQVMQESANS